MEKIAIVCSSRDPAGVNIRDSLISGFGFQETGIHFENNPVFRNTSLKNREILLYTTGSELINSENIDKRIDSGSIIFISKHRSRENTPSFAVHSIGNFGTNELGGKEKTLCSSSPLLLKSIFLELNKFAAKTGFEITMEATHHGPYTEKPSVFAEIGSTEKEWTDKANGEIMAKAIMAALNMQDRGSCNIAVGLGGPHYCNNFNKIALNNDIAFSFICPKFNLDKIDELMLKQAIEKTKEKIDFFVLDWKGLGKEKQNIVEMLTRMNIEFKRTDKII